MHACRLQSEAGRGAGPKLAPGDGPSFRSVALLYILCAFQGEFEGGRTKWNEGAQESKGGAQASKGGAAPRYVALANSLRDVHHHEYYTIVV